jgi:Tfp pilus assembly protein FimT
MREKKAIFKPAGAAGFTLIELVMILLLVGILSALAITMFPDMGPIRSDMTAEKVQSDIRYAQSLAVSTQCWAGIAFSAAADTYSLYMGSLDDGISVPSGWAIIADPLTRKNYTVQLNSAEFAGIDMTIVYFNGYNNYLVFDRWGNPYSYTGSGSPIALDNPAGVRLAYSSGTVDVRVERGTGRVYTQ